MEDWKSNQEILVMDGRIKVPYGWAAGEVGSIYLSSLCNDKKFKGTKCPSCEKVYHIPRQYCPVCFEECDEWVDLSSAGVLESYTIVRQHHPLLSPLESRFGYGIIKLDGADTGFLHLLSEFDDEELKVGSRVEAVFKEEREGHILDVEYFKPVREVE